MPLPVRALLNQSTAWRGAELIDAFVERCTDLRDGRPSPSQSDLLALVGLEEQLGVVAIEAKVDEGFDKTVNEWRAQPSSGKDARLAGLCTLFGLDPATVGTLRYQLLHRTASAVIEAKRYRARQAAMIVQSWSACHDGYDEYNSFLTATGLGGSSEPGRLCGPVAVDGVALWTGWSSEAG